MYIDYLLTSIVLLVLVVCVIYKAKLYPEGNPYFFNVNNATAMRGFWCIVVVMVHIPSLYQNRIQDMIGSFAYIGVTFFFLTSAYGLTLGIRKRPQSVKYFWRKRLPKLLIPPIVANLLFLLLFYVLFGEKISMNSIFYINAWVKWLLFCYLIFWGTHLLCRDAKYGYIPLCVAVAVFSLCSYYLGSVGIVTSTIWPTEVFGFIWGALLAVYSAKVQSLGKSRWLSKCVVSCCVALILGLSYLKFKPIAFFGNYLLKIALGFAITAFILLLNTKISIGNRPILFLGNMSYEVYLIHSRVFQLIQRSFDQLKSGEFILICVIVTVFLAAIIHFISKAIVKRLYTVSWFNAENNA